MTLPIGTEMWCNYYSDQLVLVFEYPAKGIRKEYVLPYLKEQSEQNKRFFLEASADFGAAVGEV